MISYHTGKNLNSLVPIAWEELLHLTSVLTPSAVLAPLWTQESSFYSLNQPRVSSHMCISTCCSLFLKGSGLRAVYGKLWLLTIQVSAHMASTQKDLPGLPYLNSTLIHYFLSNRLFFLIITSSSVVITVPNNRPICLLFIVETLLFFVM